MLPKIIELKRTIEARGLRALIEVDGGVSPDNIVDLDRAGAQIFVAGSAVFDKGDPRRRARGLVNQMSRAQRQG